MIKLIKSNFSRLWKSKIFWLGMIFMFGMGIYAVFSRYTEVNKKPEYSYDMEDLLFSGCMFMIVIAAVFIGLFIGTDYHNGTIRNKLIVGHTRTEVYFSNFIVCISALLIMHFAYFIPVIGVGFPLVGNSASAGSLIKLTLISITTLISLCSIFLLISMLIHSKSNASVTAIIISVLFLMSAMMIQNKLDGPEYYEDYDYVYTDEEGTIHEEHIDREKNYDYVDGTKRKVYEFLYDFLPGCQMLQITQQNPENPERLPIYSFSIIVVTTACGIFFFRRKNLK